MTTCPHDWRPMTAAFIECWICGAIRTATPPTPYVHMQSGQVCIPTTTIKGVPIEWPPIDETESHD
jgi:hypothetical protein